MKVRVVKPFGGYKAGQVFEWGDGMARILIGRGLIEAVEVAAVEQRAERAAVEPQFRRRGK